MSQFNKIHFHYFITVRFLKNLIKKFEYNQYAQSKANTQVQVDYFSLITHFIGLIKVLLPLDLIFFLQYYCLKFARCVFSAI